MPRACSWSVAITSPPAFGCSRRTSASRVVRGAQHGRQPLALERQRRAQPLARRAPRRARSSKVAECIEPSGAVHSICPFVVGK